MCQRAVERCPAVVRLFSDFRSSTEYSVFLIQLAVGFAIDTNLYTLHITDLHNKLIITKESDCNSIITTY